jgi:hypothetical protein
MNAPCSRTASIRRTGGVIVPGGALLSGELPVTGDDSASVGILRAARLKIVACPGVQVVTD